MRGLKISALICLAAAWLAGCGGHEDPNAGAPPPTKIVSAGDENVFQVDHPEKYPVTTAVEHRAASELKVTASVNPDIAKTVPVISLATGRVVEIKARLGDTVKKGQVLLRVQSADIAGAYSDYQKAVADETLARTQRDRAKDLYDKGAISQNDFQVAQDTESKALVDVQTTAEKLRVLGNSDLDRPSGVVDIKAPISGVITDQEITAAGGVQGLSSPNPFTIADLSTVWVIGDVYENDLTQVHLGDGADIRLNAFPDKVFKGRIDNISPVLDPNLRTAKVRIEVPNPGAIMKVGMFVVATFHGRTERKYAAVPAAAILHLHDRDWVYVPAGANAFRRVEVKGGEMIAGGMQVIASGIEPGQRVIANALELQNAVEQQ
jgi:cobalt-zinc-cadmium efflux system membrane fusion protein